MWAVVLTFFVCFITWNQICKLKENDCLDIYAFISILRYYGNWTYFVWISDDSTAHSLCIRKFDFFNTLSLNNYSLCSIETTALGKRILLSLSEWRTWIFAAFKQYGCSALFSGLRDSLIWLSRLTRSFYEWCRRWQ